MSSREIITIKGGRMRNRDLYGEIIIRRHPKTVSIIWEPHSLDSLPYYSDKFAAECERLEMIKRLEDCFYSREKTMSNRAVMFPDCRWGRALYIEPEQAEEMIDIIKEIWGKAILFANEKQKEFEKEMEDLRRAGGR